MSGQRYAIRTGCDGTHVVVDTNDMSGVANCPTLRGAQYIAKALNAKQPSKSLFAIRPCVLRKVVNYIEEELGLSIYGDNLDLDAHVQYEGQRDFSANDVLQLRTLLVNGVEFTRNRP
jgi:hypothetical protein